MLVLAASTTAHADVWDTQTINDDPSATRNELVHGSDQVHDLAARPGPSADEDWYALFLNAHSSYEVVVDATSGDIGSSAGSVLAVDRLLADGTIFGQAQPIGLGFSRSMRVHNPLDVAVDDKFMRVRSGGCTTTCTPSAVYRIRFYETTYSVPRFNNSATQITVLILQNPADYTIAGTVYFWSGAGMQLGTGSAFNLDSKQTLVLNTSAIPGVAGQSGSITIAHNARYGDLAGKAVALEPATGFSFDSPMVPRGH